jgi:hypothetical protein
MMPSIAKLYPSKYLAAADFEGQRLTVMIKDVRRAMMDGDKEDKKSKPEEKVMVQFDGVPKLCLWPRTNSEACFLLFGSDFSEKWIGHKVTLASRKVEKSGEIVDAIRVIGSPEIKEPMHKVVKRGFGKRAKKIVLDMEPTKDVRWAPDGNGQSKAAPSMDDPPEPAPDLGDPLKPTPEELAEMREDR